jgi:aminoglycoside 6-adenylyltransferase
VSDFKDARQDTHAEILARLQQWAKSDANVRAIIQAGSASRSSGNTDRFSDRDIELICHDPTTLAQSDGWIHDLAPVWVMLHTTSGNFQTRLVFFAGGRKIDFTLADDSYLQDMQETQQLHHTYVRGYKVLLDKDGVTAGLPVPRGTWPRRSLPTEAEFIATVNEFWFEAAHMPTYLTRQDLWVVKWRDALIKDMLLRMLEWHTLYAQGADTDIWYRGTRLKRWLDPELWNAVHETFGQFGANDSFRATLATMHLFTHLTHKIADMAEFSVPESESHIQAYVLEFAGRFQ